MKVSFFLSATSFTETSIFKGHVFFATNLKLGKLRYRDDFFFK